MTRKEWYAAYSQERHRLYVLRRNGILSEGSVTAIYRDSLTQEPTFAATVRPAGALKMHQVIPYFWDGEGKVDPNLLNAVIGPPDPEPKS